MSERLKAYARAGVDVDLGNKVKAGLPSLVESANRPEVLGKVGGFGGLFSARFPKMRDPVLVASIDGVGTKLKVAVLMNRHDTIGEDLVNHCVNDIAVLGAEPLFFLDYMASERLEPHRFRQLISGMIRGCKNAGCALIGGETAQMPGIYHGADYDLVGTIVGVVDRPKIIDGKSIRAGDVVIGLPSSGLHTNGYSLAKSYSTSSAAGSRHAATACATRSAWNCSARIRFTCPTSGKSAPNSKSRALRTSQAAA